MQGDVREIVTAWSTETTILRRLIYKNRSQHGRATYFRALERLVRFASRDFSEERLRPPQRRRTETDGSAATRSALLESCVVADNAVDVVLAAEKCASKFHALLARTYFMPFALVAIAAAARLRALAVKIVRRAAASRDAVERRYLSDSRRDPSAVSGTALSSRVLAVLDRQIEKDDEEDAGASSPRPLAIGGRPQVFDRRASSSDDSMSSSSDSE